MEMRTKPDNRRRMIKAGIGYLRKKEGLRIRINL